MTDKKIVHVATHDSSPTPFSDAMATIASGGILGLVPADKSHVTVTFDDGSQSTGGGYDDASAIKSAIKSDRISRGIW